MKVTIKMIAERAGVHPATVDKVLHNRIGVSDEVRHRVQKIIQELDYHPNPTGRLLQRQGLRYRIAAILVDVDSRPFLLEGIRKGIEAREGFDIELIEETTSFQDAAGQASIIARMINENVDAIILSPINSPEVRNAIDRAEESGIPVITTNSDIEGSKRFCYVGQDGRASSRVAGRLMGLLLNGRGKVAVVSSAIAEENNSFHVMVREKGFRDFVSGVFPEISICEVIESFESAEITYRETVRVLNTYPDLKGIYVTCGGVAEVGRAVRESGRADRIRIISFEDYPEILELIRDEVVDVTISSELVRQGELPVELIMEYLIFGRKPEKREIFTDIRLLLRECIF